ncbi:hypothetical protein D3C84_817910 [compost metagenome]
MLFDPVRLLFDGRVDAFGHLLACPVAFGTDVGDPGVRERTALMPRYLSVPAECVLKADADRAVRFYAYLAR